jgi:hypothetical protein
VTLRDRYVIAIVAVVGFLGIFWFMGLSPKREKSAKLDKDIAAAQQSLQTAEQEKAQFAQAQVQFPTLYASIGRLGKAVPADEDVPSLLVELNHAAGKSGVDFRSIELKVDKNDTATAAPPAAAGGATSGEAASGSAAGGGSASGGTSASGATASASAASASASGATGASGAAASPTAPGATAGAPAAAASATATLQPLPFEYKFKGNFFKLKKVLAAIADMVEARNREVAISGRLISVDGFTLKEGNVTILATSYLLPAGQSLLGGASPGGPAGIDPNAPQPASAGSSTSPAPPTATVTAP